MPKFPPADSVADRSATPAASRRSGGGRGLARFLKLARRFRRQPVVALDAFLQARQLEPRRLLDGGGAAALLAGIDVEFVQTAPLVGEQADEAASVEAVGNSDPSNLTIAPLPAAQEGDVAILRASFSDPDLADQHHVEVAWGDGSRETFALTPGERSFEAAHAYLDDDPSRTPADRYVVGVRVVDSGGAAVEGTASLEVRNVSPRLSPLAPIETDEGEFASLEIAFVDPGLSDVHTVVVSWGDGLVESRTLPTGVRTYALEHRYADDRPSSAGTEAYPILVLLFDDDGGFARGATTAEVRNVAPSGLAFSPVAAIDEGGVATLELSFVDPGLSDVHTVEVTWGDGTSTTHALPAGARTLAATHAYADDDPSGTPSDVYAIGVRVTDDDGGAVAAATTVLVRNVAPYDLRVVAPTIAIDEGTAFTIDTFFADPGLLDAHSFAIDWGDGTLSSGVVAGRSFRAGHTYGDNGNYAISTTVFDDDGGSAAATVRLAVVNVDPVLTGADAPFRVDEGAAVTLAALGVGLRDPGFDNPFNTGDSANGGETSEQLFAYAIDWGDGRGTIPVQTVGRSSGSPGVPTTAQFSHAAYVYADDGVYRASLQMSDDDGAVVVRHFTVEVRNVAPTLTLTATRYAIDEGTVLALLDLGAFTDPGFDNPLNPLAGGEVAETFFYSIAWGDGTVETGQLPATRVSGGPGQPASGTLQHSHFYADNDRDGVRDNRYTIVVTLQDDDGGSHVQQIDVGVRNVNPVLQPIVATDVNARGQTTLQLAFADAGADDFQILVDWGDRLAEPDPDKRFVVERAYAGATPQTFVFTHFYAGPPNPLNPAADIVIRTRIWDDDFGFAGMVAPGESNEQQAVISNPGTGNQPIRIDTTPQVPRLAFPVRSALPPPVANVAAAKEAADAVEAGGAAGESKAAGERYLELRIVYPDGTQSAGFRLPGQALQDLPRLFRGLPDNRYAVYLVQPETGLQRLVVEVFVRNGRLVDPVNEAEETRDRPPRDPAASSAAEPGAGEAAAEPADAGSSAPPAAERPAGEPPAGEALTRGAAEGAPRAEAGDGDENAAGDAAGVDDERFSRAVLRRRAAAWAVLGTAAQRLQGVEEALGQSSPADWRRLRRGRRRAGSGW